MAEENTEKIPIDTKLLTDAVIELNISRRSVGLYPREHPITRSSVVRAFQFLEKLFQLRSAITLGIAKDTLMIDEYVLDKKNPVFREFALVLHSKGIAAVTFYSGLVIEELLTLHELIADKESSVGQALVEAAVKNGLRHIILTPIDLSKFGFAVDEVREEGAGIEILENYIHGLIEGRLSEDEADGVVRNIAPEEIASFMNDQATQGAQDESYDRVIATYLKRKEHQGVNAGAFTKFLSLVESLNPGIKQQFLKRVFLHPSANALEYERLIGELSPDNIEKFMSIFQEHSSLIPESIRNLLDKLKLTKEEAGYFDIMAGKKALIDDIELDENILGLFREDHFEAFVPQDYQRELNRMLKGSKTERLDLTGELEHACRVESVEKKFSELVLELLDTDLMNKEDYEKSLTEITGMVEDFLETGRFDEIAEIYDRISSHAFSGRFKVEASAMLGNFFLSDEYREKLIHSLKLWGRHNREGAVKLAAAQKRYIMEPLFNALSEESEPSVRKFLLHALMSFGGDVVKEAAKRLNDTRWYVVRNMIYIIREAGGTECAANIRKFAKDKDRRLAMEAVRTLLQFRTPDAMSYVKFYLQSDDPDIREQVVRLAGTYRCREAVPLLLGLLEKKDVFGSEYYYKTSVIKSLGDIGDPSALGPLLRMFSAKSLLFKGTVEEIRTEIFRNLKNYPPASLTPLLKAGLASRNDEIRSISERLLRTSQEKDDTGKNI